jgi:hypothetical protein
LDFVEKKASILNNSPMFARRCKYLLRATSSQGAHSEK